MTDYEWLIFSNLLLEVREVDEAIHFVEEIGGSRDFARGGAHGDWEIVSPSHQRFCNRDIIHLAPRRENCLRLQAQSQPHRSNTSSLSVA